MRWRSDSWISKVTWLSARSLPSSPTSPGMQLCKMRSPICSATIHARACPSRLTSCSGRALALWSACVCKSCRTLESATVMARANLPSSSTSVPSVFARLVGAPPSEPSPAPPSAPLPPPTFETFATATAWNRMSNRCSSISDKTLEIALVRRVLDSVTKSSADPPDPPPRLLRRSDASPRSVSPKMISVSAPAPPMSDETMMRGITMAMMRSKTRKRPRSTAMKHDEAGAMVAVTVSVVLVAALRWPQTCSTGSRISQPLGSVADSIRATTTEAVVSSARSTTVGDPARASVMCVRVAVSSPCSPNVSTASQSLLVPSPAVVLLPLPAAADF
mmetsp:Transcript_22562/g.52267  ORF Transcript_22562/g.52267 Transcript_22562/m.52267 type:complete len:333 (-) Transcript_22562:3461-4459(-)